MTRRITLPIEGATETECVGCQFLAEGRRCVMWGHRIRIRHHTDERGVPHRHPACLAAEATHAAMVRDARLGAVMRKINVPLAEAEARLRRLRSDIGSMQLSYPGGGYSLRFELALMEAYVAALRSEVPE